MIYLRSFGLLAFIIVVSLISARVAERIAYARGVSDTPQVAAHTAEAAAPAVTPDAGVDAAPAVTPAPAQPTSQPTVAPASPADDIGLAAKLWHNGSFIALGILVLYLLLTYGAALEPKWAFYISAVLGGLTTLVEAIRRGDTPTATALIGAVTTIVGILARGPQKAPA